MNTALHETVRGGVVTKAIRQVIERLSVLQKVAFLSDLPNPLPRAQKICSLYLCRCRNSLLIWRDRGFFFFSFLLYHRLQREGLVMGGDSERLSPLDFKRRHIMPHCHNGLPGPPLWCEDDMAAVTSQRPIMTSAPFPFFSLSCRIQCLLEVAGYWGQYTVILRKLFWYFWVSLCGVISHFKIK